MDQVAPTAQTPPHALRGDGIAKSSFPGMGTRDASTLPPSPKAATTASGSNDCAAVDPSVQTLSTFSDSQLLTACIDGQILSLKPVYAPALQRIVFVPDPNARLPFAYEPVTVQMVKLESKSKQQQQQRQPQLLRFQQQQVQPQHSPQQQLSVLSPATAVQPSGQGAAPRNAPVWSFPFNSLGATSSGANQLAPASLSLPNSDPLAEELRHPHLSYHGTQPPKFIGTASSASAPAQFRAGNAADLSLQPGHSHGSYGYDEAPQTVSLSSASNVPLGPSVTSHSTTVAQDSPHVRADSDGSGSGVSTTESSSRKVPGELRKFFGIAGITHSDYINAVRSKNPHILHLFDCYVRSQCEAAVADLSDAPIVARRLYTTFLAFFLTNHYLYHSQQATRALSESDLQVVCWLKGLYDLNVDYDTISPQMVYNAVQWHAAATQKVLVQQAKKKKSQSMAAAYGSYAASEYDYGLDDSESALNVEENPDEFEGDIAHNSEDIGTMRDRSLLKIGCRPCAHAEEIAKLADVASMAATGAPEDESQMNQASSIPSQLPVLQPSWTLSGSSNPSDEKRQSVASSQSLSILRALWASDAVPFAEQGKGSSTASKGSESKVESNGSLSEQIYCNVHGDERNPLMCNISSCACCSGAASHPFTFLLLPNPSTTPTPTAPLQHQVPAEQVKPGITSPDLVQVALASLGGGKAQESFSVHFAQLSQSAQLTFPAEALIPPCLCHNESQCVCAHRRIPPSQPSPQPVLTKAQKLPYPAKPQNFWKHWIAVEKTIATISSVWALPVQVFYGFLSFEQTVNHFRNRPDGYLFRLSNSSPNLIVFAYSKPSAEYQARLAALRKQQGFVREADVAHLLPPPTQVSQVQMQAFTSIESFVQFLQTNPVTRNGVVYGPPGPSSSGATTDFIVSKLLSHAHQALVNSSYKQYSSAFNPDADRLAPRPSSASDDKGGVEAQEGLSRQQANQQARSSEQSLLEHHGPSAQSRANGYDSTADPVQGPSHYLVNSSYTSGAGEISPVNAYHACE